MRLPHDEELDPAAFEALLASALADEEEIAEQRALIAWFRRRYPTAGERLAYARNMYAQWTRPPDA